LQTSAFLARVVPDTGYIAITTNTMPGTTGKYVVRMFEAGDYAGAAGFAHWATTKGFDVYHSIASFTTALAGLDQRGKPKYQGRKSADNVALIRSFIVDLDCARPAAITKPGTQKTYADQTAALTWLAGFVRATGLPRPNMVVNSGYGLHAYWVLENPMTRDEWEPYGDALKTMLAANNFTGDAGISGDVARILRPAGTLNCKTTPHMPVLAIPKLHAGDYPNELVLARLRPFISAKAAVKSGTAVLASKAAQALSGGGATVVSMFAGAANMNAAAQANLPPAQRPVRLFSIIADKCNQVKQSIANGGNGDAYPVWYLGHITMAVFTPDGIKFVHALGDQDPRYDPVQTDAAYARAVTETTGKGSGPPTCTHYQTRGDATRCDACPFKGKITTPWELGRAESELPGNYRRNNGMIEQWLRVPNTETSDWQPILSGDVDTPVLDELPGGGHVLRFTYALAGKSHGVEIFSAAIPDKGAALVSLLHRQNMSLSPGREAHVRAFIMAWLDQLRRAGAERSDRPLPFGWAMRGSKVTGFAVGGTVYRPDGTTESIGGGDKQLVAHYTPAGDIALWKPAADCVARSAPQLAALLAASFAAPLVKMTGQSGMILAIYSLASGVGKSTAMNAAQTVWGNIAAMNGLDDTHNALIRKLSETRHLPALWDELRIEQDKGQAFVATVFQLSQGKERSRLSADIQLREMRTWQTMLATAANVSILDLVLSHTQSTEAGVLRVFEDHMLKGNTLFAPGGSMLFAKVRDNYGHAGRIYAAFLAKHHDSIQASVTKVSQDLATRLQAEQSERLYIALMAVLLVGAASAKSLGLVDFDLPTLRAWLEATFLKLRAARTNTVLVNGGVVDIEQLFGTLMSDWSANRLVSEQYLPRGSAPGRTGGGQLARVFGTPQNGHAILSHASQVERAIRLDRNQLQAWLRKKGQDPANIIGAMVQTLGAKEARNTLGSGTGLPGQRVATIELPVPAGHWLEDYLLLGSNPTLQHSTTVAPPVPVQMGPGKAKP
jgi:hypothetical protein